MLRWLFGVLSVRVFRVLSGCVPSKLWRLVSRLLDGPRQRAALGIALRLCDRLSIDVRFVPAGVRRELRRLRHELFTAKLVLELFELHIGLLAV